MCSKYVLRFNLKIESINIFTKYIPQVRVTSKIGVKKKFIVKNTQYAYNAMA